MPARLADEAGAQPDFDAPAALPHAVDETASDADRQRDDLKRIRGVGPVLERTLNGLGIYSLAQIANFSQDDIERISAQLPQFPGRIERDRWIEQARSLLQ